jgi:hypothetical protein
MSTTCEFCNKTFCKLSNLTKHKKTSLKCIKIQKDQGIEVKTNKIECEFCKKHFTIKYDLIRHLKTCKIFKFESLKKWKIL